jgi:hypothetical protein
MKGSYLPSFILFDGPKNISSQIWIRARALVRGRQIPIDCTGVQRAVGPFTPIQTPFFLFGPPNIPDRGGQP